MDGVLVPLVFLFGAFAVGYVVLSFIFDDYEH